MCRRRCHGASDGLCGIRMHWPTTASSAPTTCPMSHTLNPSPTTHCASSGGSVRRRPITTGQAAPHPLSQPHLPVQTSAPQRPLSAPVSQHPITTPAPPSDAPSTLLSLTLAALRSPSASTPHSHPNAPAALFPTSAIDALARSATASLPAAPAFGPPADAPPGPPAAASDANPAVLLHETAVSPEAPSALAGHSPGGTASLCEVHPICSRSPSMPPESTAGTP